MVNIRFQTLQNTFSKILLQHDFTPGDAKQIARIFSENTFDGVFSHGINRFPRFIDDVKNGIVVPGATPEKIQGMGALEQWNGHQGPGIPNALLCSQRSVALARESGIGCVGLSNTNHWLRGGTYGWKVAGEGFLFIGWTNTLPNMPPWGGSSAALGNNPLILAIPREGGHLVLDMAMSLYSYGKLEWHQKCGTFLPEFGGYNKNGELTKDPAEILVSERILPVGMWKGSALAMVLDLAAAIISGGKTTRQIGDLPRETGISQVFISIDINRHMNRAQMDGLIRETMEYITGTNPEARYPGQNSLERREHNLEHGVEIPRSTWEEIQKL